MGFAPPPLRRRCHPGFAVVATASAMPFSPSPSLPSLSSPPPPPPAECLPSASTTTVNGNSNIGYRLNGHVSPFPLATGTTYDLQVSSSHPIRFKTDDGSECKIDVISGTQTLRTVYWTGDVSFKLTSQCKNGEGISLVCLRHTGMTQKSVDRLVVNDQCERPPVQCPAGERRVPETNTCDPCQSDEFKEGTNALDACTTKTASCGLDETLVEIDGTHEDNVYMKSMDMGRPKQTRIVRTMSRVARGR